MSLNTNNQAFEKQNSLDDSKEFNSPYSKVLDFQNISNHQQTSNFATYYTLNKLNQQIEDRNFTNTNDAFVKLRHKYKKQKKIRTGFFYTYLLITIVQRPTWCNFIDYEEYCTIQNEVKIPTMIGFYCPLYLYYLVEIISLAYLILSKIVKAFIIRSSKRKTTVICLTVIGIVIIINNIIVLELENNYNYNISSLFKPLFIVLFKQSLYKMIINYCKIINKGKEIYYLMIISLLLFSAFGKAIFLNYQDIEDDTICQIDQPPFSQPNRCTIITLFILQTTVNSPDIYLQYYQDYRPYLLYFIIFQFVNTVLIINLAIAFFYSAYKVLIEEETLVLLSKYNEKIERFFLQRKNSDVQRIASIIDNNNLIPSTLYLMLDNKYYEFFMEFLCLISFISIFYKQNLTTLYILFGINSVLLTESIILFYYSGFNKLKKKTTLLLDLIISFGILLLICLELSNQNVLQFLYILLSYRLLRGCKWLLQSENFTNLIISLVQISSYTFQLFGTLLILFMFFSSFGQLLFGGKITDSSLNNNYQLANFNDFLSGMTTCWFLLIVNNWNVLSYNYAQIFQSDYVYLFFISFYIIVVLLALNVTIALLIDYLVRKIDFHKSSNSQSQISMNIS